MAELSTLARPYARAAFETAAAAGTLPAWGEALARVAAVAADPQVVPLLSNPKVGREALRALFLAAGGGAFDAAQTRFVALLAENDRLIAAGEVARLFDEFRADAEGVVEAQVVSAQPLDAAEQAKIAAALKARLNKEVKLECRTDEGLLGGAVIRAGDLVIDGSAKGRLLRLATALGH